MIETNQLKRGVCIVHRDAPMIVVDVSLSSPTARGASMIAKTKLRNLLTGQLITESFRSGEKWPEADLEQRPCTYLYSDGTRWYFMDLESFEQFDLGESDLGESVGYLKDGLEGLRAMYVQGQLANVQLPLAVELEVKETIPAIKGATAAAQLKSATLETGLEIQVPAYIVTGEVIRVDTRDGHFIERAKG
jgi:elongation factor P